MNTKNIKIVILIFLIIFFNSCKDIVTMFKDEGTDDTLVEQIGSIGNQQGKTLTNDHFRTYINNLTVTSKGEVYAATTDMIYCSKDNGNSWDSVYSKTGSITSTSGFLFLGGYGFGIIRSTNGGKNWYDISTGLRSKYIYALVANGSSVFAGTLGGIERTTNFGVGWNIVFSSTISGDYPSSSVIDANNNIYFGMQYGIMKSTNNGVSWSKIPNPVGSVSPVRAFIVVGNGIIVASAVDAGIYRTTNNGVTWTKVYSNNSVDMYSFCSKSEFIYVAGGSKGVLKSSDNGITWIPLTSSLKSDIDNVTVVAIAPNGDILAGTNKGIYRSADNGQTWSR